ncbi:MAG: DUF4923 family protein [Prevotellaceae bacterium]|nr:DUF4923 family protein [Prevotellaceae bacterium]
MKKMIFRMAITAMVALAVPAAANAQLSDVLKKVASSVSSSSSSSSTSKVTSVVSDLVSNLLGSNKLTEDNLTGTWNYTEPSVVLESDNVLSKIGGTAVTNKIQEQEKNFLEKIGFKAGSVVLVLDSDKSGYVSIDSKKINVTWDVDDTDLVLTIAKKDLKMNASLSSGTLQLAMSADKMLDLVSAIISGVSNIASSASILTTLLSKYDGLYLGLQFSKESE